MYSIIGIDPGSSTAGLSILKFNDSLDIMEIETFLLINTINVARTIKDEISIEDRYIKFEFLINKILDYNNSELVTVIYESGFANPKRPAAFKPLIRIQGILINTINKRYPNVFIKSITPSQVKNAVYSKGDSSKANVSEALLSIDEIKSKIKINFNTYGISDHEIDAIAIAYSELIKIREVGFINYFYI